MKHYNIKITSIVLFIFLYIFTNFYNVFADDSNSNSSNTGFSNINLYCNSDILVDGNSGAILYGKNEYNKVYPASTTKIMTAILVLESIDDLNSSVVVSKNAIYSTPEESSTIDLKIGEVMSVKDLLYGLLLNSGNDAANVLAETVSGNISSFVDKMNEKAKELGCLNTHFANPHGFHDPNHYTTAYDMMKIFTYALKNPTFKQICETKTYVINETNKTNQKRYLKNTDRLLFTTSEDPYGAYYQYALGGKTGYTIEARGTFVGFAQKDNDFLLVGCFDGSQNISGHEARFLDAVTLFNAGFNTYSPEDIINKDKTTFEVIDKLNSKKYILGLNSNISSLTDKNAYTLNYNIDLNFDNIYNLEKNKDNTSVAGTLNYKVTSKNWTLSSNQSLYLIKSENIFSINYILRKFYKLILVLILILILIIALIFIRITNKNKSHKKINRNNLDFSRRNTKRIRNFKR